MEPGIKEIEESCTGKLAVVTGAAGFIGSHLVELLLDQGLAVRGIDCLTPYYDRVLKQANLKSFLHNPCFSFFEEDLLTCDLAQRLDGANYVFHLAGQPGVRMSWSDDFGSYLDHNVATTQRLLDQMRNQPVERFLFASSSSIYGNIQTDRIQESHRTRPYSPYGITKLAGEMLCNAYAENFGVPTVSLRYFTVYGPRQRPDMATHRLIESTLTGNPFTLFGDGRHVRDFTFVEDVVHATFLAATKPVENGDVFNIAGGSQCNMKSLIEEIEMSLGRPVPVTEGGEQPGDVAKTSADTAHARDVLGWTPRTALNDGIEKQVAWHKERRLHPSGGDVVTK